MGKKNGQFYGRTPFCGKSVHPKCELDIPCVHYDKDGNQVGEVTITDFSHLLEGNLNLFSLTRLQNKGWTLTDNVKYIKLQKGGNSLLFNIVVNTPKGALYVGKFSRKGGGEVMGGAADKAPTYSIKWAHELLGHNNEDDRQGKLQVIWDEQSPEDLLHPFSRIWVIYNQNPIMHNRWEWVIYNRRKMVPEFPPPFLFSAPFLL